MATFGDVVTYTCDERTSYNQEALGLPIAFHGTSVPAPTWVQLPQHLVFAAAGLFAWRAPLIGVVSHFQRQWPGSCEALDDVAFQLDPRAEGLAWLLQTSASDADFCANLLHFISDMVQAKTLGNASIESAPDVLRHLRHGIGWGHLFETATEFWCSCVRCRM